MRILTWNVNGLRSLISSGNFEQIFDYNPDVICLQETKLSDNSMFDGIVQNEYRVFSNLSETKGRNGVCIFTRLSVKSSSDVIGHKRFDSEGRYLYVELENGYSIINIYMPHGKRNKSDMSYKLDVAQKIIQLAKSLCNKQAIICTDFNIAHKEIDLARAKENRNNTMFTDDERSIVSKLLESNFTDAFRYCCAESGQYTWWPYGFHAKERNIGWRIDYYFVSDILKNKIKNVNIYKDITGSDHCPIIMDIGVNEGVD